MSEPNSKEAPRSKEKIWSRDFIMICMANFFIFLGFQMTMPTIPLFVNHLGGNDQLVGFVVGIFTFSALLVRPNAGKLLETKGRRFVFLIGLSIFVLSLGTFGFLTSMVMLFVMRVVQGIGWGFSSTASGTIATDLIPARRRGEGMGYYGLSSNIALALGPSLGLALTDVITFEQLFLICAGLGIAAIILASTITYQKVEKPVHEIIRKKFDVFEKSALPPSFLLFFITVTFGGISTFLPLYTVQRGVDGIQWYFLIYALALMVTRLYAGRVYDKYGHIAVFIPSMLMILAAMLLLAWMPNNAILYTAAVLYGLGFGTVQPALQAWSIEKAEHHRKGMANATFFSFFDLGVGIGAILFGQIGHLLGYSSIYITSALSIFMAMVIYFIILQRERKVV